VHAGSIVVDIATYLLQNNELFAVSSQDDDFLCFNPFSSVTLARCLLRWTLVF